MKKIIAIALALFFIAGIAGIYTVGASEDVKASPKEGLHKSEAQLENVGIVAKVYDNPILKQFGEVADVDYVAFRGQNYTLYPVFRDRDKALKVFYNEYAGLLGDKAPKELNDTNWRDFAGLVKEALLASTSLEARDKLNAAEQFIDVFSGYALNKKVKDYVAANSVREAEQAYFEELALSMPHTSPLYIQYKNHKPPR